MLDRLVLQFEDQATAYGVKDKLASVRSVEFPVLEMEEGRERLSALLVEQAVKAVQEDGAHVIILGCTGMMGLALEVEEGLRERGCPVPVIDPATVALKTAEALVDLGLSHSKKSYPYPPKKEIIGY